MIVEAERKPMSLFALFEIFWPPVSTLKRGKSYTMGLHFTAHPISKSTPDLTTITFQSISDISTQCCWNNGVPHGSVRALLLWRHHGDKGTVLSVIYIHVEEIWWSWSKTMDSEDSRLLRCYSMSTGKYVLKFHMQNNSLKQQQPTNMA